MPKELFRNTFSVCPVCLKRIEAELIKDTVTNEIKMKKSCPSHGAYSTVIWRGYQNIENWIGSTKPISKGENLNCPTACGLCSDHLRESCCILLEVTKRCNLSCEFCFADGGQGEDVSFDYIASQLKALTTPNETLVQLSGGEPTVRDDLPEIIALAKKAGCRYVQLNSNGIRLAEDESYLNALADAGLSFVFLQFDGISDDVYQKLRNRDLFEIKQKAIENCGKYNIGVTLVPTLVPGVNEHQIGDILRFGIEHSPIVRGVHYQPVSYFGRMPSPPTDESRITLDELMHLLIKQSNGALKPENLTPSCCDHPLCGFHGDFMILPNGTISPLRKTEAASCCSDTAKDISAKAAEKNRAFVARRWERNAASNCCDAQLETKDLADMDNFLERIRSHGFTVTSMYFQDAFNIDLERLRQCSLHVFNSGKKIPFCANYLTNIQE